MLIRLRVILYGAVCGLLLGIAVTYLHPAWIFQPQLRLNRNTAYFRTVLDLVRQTMFDGKEADSDRLTRAALDGMIRSLDRIPSSCGLMPTVICGRRWTGGLEDRHPVGAAGRPGPGGCSDRGHAGRSGRAFRRGDEIVKS